ncbi:MAG: acyl-CoA dehydrogenase [Candidatus Schekmanbacteria bacterium RIFCSPHIGHO2_02_FULL_38_11]|uniref:Acyl-CoA dehydrogenase n=1 Tax=Candidatus Schekmanbacteria bacterium RIFCSPLOWO2_12_FULL_38_15 TaxID=1817883 RepID=A0A1F7SGT1_9BACT|nr:MAG: acyl-CoA dehydrogenase [Candidatus Schekmanbacteria bacterium GWA2_38_9]OGL49647.1 MAG: acyl-CoA dehydrogenase [Candidatus Schekmanbacteria bacterium RIFCSPLOWO2_02_FULL_38_14]OGL50369.1 MAG: acyl-CoA dehydrogenase [Candidatus Schekmanbacteria bacterium RIFCSPHIGHO2_02_FULL_38_11]OGL53000.1 MAG: acyl-CoA dehydrogenase [Candidatus Schekmanbacteria bacterium RIFCSPLOWO2_12_FULL_38_15]
MYELTEEQKMLKELARQIAEEEIKPIRAELDNTGEFPYKVVKALVDADLMGLFIPTEYGGSAQGTFEMCLVMEELSKACGGIALCYGATALGTYPILLFGSEEQKKKYLPRIVKGELAAFALTEAEAGSDAGGVRLKAEAGGDYYVLNGVKQWITNGGVAEIYTVIAATNKARGSRGLSGFIVEKNTPGFTFGNKADKMGIRASITSELVFEDCHVPKANMLGKEGMGFPVAIKTLDKARPGVAAQALGIAQGALDEAVAYSKTRVQFGKAISTFQTIQVMLADMATKTEAARALVYSVAKYIDSGASDISKESAMCKLYASDVAMEVTTDAVQILGGYGYMRDYPVEKMMRDAKITQIYEGTNQIQRLVIANRLLR